MLTEEALILLATLAATGLLVLGVLELVWPTTPRTRTVRAPAMPRARAPFESLLAPRDAAPSTPGPLAVDAERASSRRQPEPMADAAQGPERVSADGEPDAASHAEPASASTVASSAPREDASPIAEPDPTFTSAPQPVPSDERARALLAESAATVDAGPVSRANTGITFAPAVPIPDAAHSRAVAPDEASPASRRDAPDAPEPAAPAPPVPREPRPHVLPIETCVAMFDEGRYTEVVSLGSAALEVHAKLGRVTDRAGEAALTALVGRSRHQLGDRDGARADYSAAVRSAEPSLRPMYVAHVVELARAAVDAGDDAAPGADAAATRLRELVESAASLDDALEVVPGDASLEGARGAVREALASACERLVDAIVAGEGGRDARTLVERALADDSMPAAWRQRVGEQLTPISSAEIGQLTAQAIRCVQEGRDGDAIAALERAERLFDALPSGTVPDERLEEFERRLWWGYTKVGLSRIDTERFEEALEPLFRALHLGGIDDQRLGETRDALVGAIDSLVADAAARAPESVAPDEVDRLAGLLRDAVARGVGEEDLGEAFAKLEALKRARS